MKTLAIITVALATAACTTTAPVARPATPIAVPQRTYPTLGLERVIGQTARGLTGLLGTANADVVEGAGRKLQFGSRICVLDAYLYPKGSGEAVVTHVDARQRDGSAIDRASCVAALSRRDGGK